MRIGAAVQVLLVVLLVGCGASGDELRIVATYTNPTDQLVYLGRCGTRPPSFIIEKQQANQWVRAYEPACEMILIPEPVVLGAGESRTDTLLLYTHRERNRIPRFEVDQLSGDYRIVYDVYRTWTPEASTPGEPLPSPDRTSNVFRLH